MTTGFSLLECHPDGRVLVGHIGLQELALGLSRLEEFSRDTIISFKIPTDHLAMSASGSLAAPATNFASLVDHAPLTVTTKSPMHVSGLAVLDEPFGP